MTSPRLSHLPHALAGRFGSTESARPEPGRKNAAVALILRPRVGETDCEVRRCDVLAIRRAESARDPWSGQMALPGGGVEGRDAGLLDAAVREVREETGLRLEGARDALGRIDPVRPQGARLPAVTVWPFVLRAPSGASARVASREVASVHWFSVADLVNRANRGAHVHRHGAEARRFPCIRIDGQVVWGLTYRIVTRFLEVV